MIAFETMLLAAAHKAGMKHPPANKCDKKRGWSKDKYPHFFVFCQLQLGRGIQWGEHWENAKIIAKIPEKELKQMTLQDFLAKGLRWQQ